MVGTSWQKLKYLRLINFSQFKTQNIKTSYFFSIAPTFLAPLLPDSYFFVWTPTLLLFFLKFCWTPCIELITYNYMLSWHT